MENDDECPPLAGDAAQSSAARSLRVIAYRGHRHHSSPSTSAPASPRMDYILLETIGLADPAPLVIDAKAFRLQIDEHKKSSSFPEAFHQIAFSDVVILNKVDLVEDNLEDLERQILEVNALVTVVQSNSSQLQELLEYSKSVPPNPVFLPCAFVSKDPVSLAKTKFVFASTFVTSTLGYSVAIAYSLSGRAAKMSLIRPRPDHVAGTPTNFHGPDRWETGDDPDYASTWLQFTPVIFFHIAIIGHLCLKRPRDVFQLTKGSPKQKDLLHRKKKQREGNEGGDKENKDAEANKEEDDEEEGEEEEEKAKVKKSKTKRTPSARPTFSLPCTAMTPLPGPLNRIPSNTFMASATRLFLNNVTTISLYAVAAGSSPRLSIPFHTLQACKRQRTSPRGSILRPAARSTSRSATRRTPVPVLGLLDHLLGDIGHLADGADDVGDEGQRVGVLRIGWAVNGLGCYVSNQGPSQLMMHHISTAEHVRTIEQNRTGNGGGWPQGSWTNGGRDLAAL
ncbi:Os07g0594900 [Oryza sativa Japonica Group]|uniref:Os07g0594900 protein n=1 Tax=Oryza sativa subsp. japonica TaxID=39947 RepID=A0A0P0X8R2_ORYSJ|nr:Os07g0594900 [Oryza sativa Japonica Group]